MEVNYINLCATADIMLLQNLNFMLSDNSELNSVVTLATCSQSLLPPPPTHTHTHTHTKPGGSNCQQPYLVINQSKDTYSLVCIAAPTFASKTIPLGCNSCLSKTFHVHGTYIHRNCDFILTFTG